MVFVKVNVNEKGQIVIPKVFRDAYDIEAGGEVFIGEKNNELVIEKSIEKTEWIAALKALPKWKVGTIDSDADYEEEMDAR